MDKTPILITFRSKKFGGKTELDSEDAYLNLVKIAIDFKLGNAIDIEHDHVSDRVAGLIQDAKAKEARSCTFLSKQKNSFGKVTERVKLRKATKCYMKAL